MKRLQVDSESGKNAPILSIVRILTVDAEGTQVEVFSCGSSFRFICQYRIDAPDFKGSVQVLLMLKNESGEEVFRDFSQPFFLDAHESQAGEISAFFPNIVLNEGPHTLHVLCAEEGFDFQQPEHQFLENPCVFFWVQTDAFLKVVDSGTAMDESACDVKGDWSSSEYVLTYSREHFPKLKLDFPRCLEQEFPEEFPLVWEVLDQVIKETKGKSFPELERNSPGLKGCDWEAYLRCSAVRMVRVLRALKKRQVVGGTLLDVGSYFGNFSLLLSKAGFQVVAIDSYKRYGNDLDFIVQLLKKEKIEVLDFQDIGEDWHQIASESFDVIACLGVIEHIPHTPRQILEPIHRVLKNEGWFLLDTPNLAYIYNRQKLAKGESVFVPINIQYYTEIPFDGHHREYTSDEITWMLQTMGQEEISIEAFFYSPYSIEYLCGKDLENFILMMEDPSSQEVLLTVSQKVNRSPVAL